MPKFFLYLIQIVINSLLLTALTPLHAADPEPRAIDDPATLSVIREVEKQVAQLRGIELKNPVKACYLTSEFLRSFVSKEMDVQFAPDRLAGYDAFLKSLKVVPPDLDLKKMYLSLLDEQVGGLYDHRTKRLYVRKEFDIEKSPLARVILAHEICHALQDSAYGFGRLGIDDTHNDDRATAGSAVVEGDAMVLTNDYSAECVKADDLLKDMPQFLTMDQTALNNSPSFFQQSLMFPYLQGEIFMDTANQNEDKNRDYVFKNPPQTSEQIIHPEKYFGTRDDPSSLTLLEEAKTSGTVSVNLGITIPQIPQGYRKLELNQMGELGVRLIFEDKLGMGISNEAAAGWDGDAYLVCRNGDGKTWICWESAWDSQDDARQFEGALVTLWRVNSAQKDAGDPLTAKQEFKAGDWNVSLDRIGSRVVATWGN